MTTLFARLSGVGLPANPSGPEETKIAIHAYSGAINELRRGYVTGPDIGAMFNLDSDQVVATTNFKDLLIAAPEKTEFMRVFKDWLYLAETRTDGRYLSQSNLVTRLQNEVTDQGGTLP